MDLPISLHTMDISQLSSLTKHCLKDAPWLRRGFPVPMHTPNGCLDLLYLQKGAKIGLLRPWTQLPRYFKRAQVSALAVAKMSAHAKLGGLIEVMGMLVGKIADDAIVVMDVYALPVEGTETRVNAQSEAYEYMVQYLDSLKALGREEHIVGWYHSHPGYGCWLSGIDVATQALNQNFQDPYLAIVIDPIRSANQKKVDLGAFRTLPAGHELADGELGAHSKHYYALDVELFHSSHDQLLIDCINNKLWLLSLVKTHAMHEEYERRWCKRVATELAKPVREPFQLPATEFHAFFFQFLRKIKQTRRYEEMEDDSSYVSEASEEPDYEMVDLDRLEQIKEANEQEESIADSVEDADASEDNGSEALGSWRDGMHGRTLAPRYRNPLAEEREAAAAAKAKEQHGEWRQRQQAVAAIGHAELAGGLARRAAGAVFAPRLA